MKLVSMSDVTLETEPVVSGGNVRCAYTVLDSTGRHRGIISQHEYNRKWAACWNMIPNDDDSFIWGSKEEAVDALYKRYL